MDTENVSDHVLFISMALTIGSEKARALPPILTRCNGHDATDSKQTVNSAMKELFSLKGSRLVLSPLQGIP